MVSRGYTQEELSDIDTQLNTHGRLFLNSLYECINRVCEEKKGKDHDADVVKKFLTPLSDELKLIETSAPPAAHFIWVGPPRNDKSELLGIRSLKEVKPNQKINFWILKEHVAHYTNLLAILNISHVELISIEDYAEKIQLSFDEQETKTLLGQIIYFRDLADKKAKDIEIKYKNKNSNNEEKSREIADMIRDRVTVVDYIKTLIPLYEGGYVFDSDLTFLKRENDVSEQLLSLQNWSFPLLEDGNTDFWFFYCQKTLEWSRDKKNGGAFTVPPVSQSAVQPHKTKNLASAALVQTKHSATTASSASASRSRRPLLNLNLPALGETMETSASNAGTTDTNTPFDRTLHLKFYHELIIRREFEPSAYQLTGLSDKEANIIGTILSGNNINASFYVQFGLQARNSSTFFKCKAASVHKPEYNYGNFTVVFRTGSVQVLKKPEMLPITIIKRYNDSHRQFLSRDHIEALQLSILTIGSEQLFEATLKQRCQLINFSILGTFDVNFCKKTDASASRVLTLKQQTMPHLSLLIRPDFFGIVFNLVPKEKIGELLAMQVNIPQGLFNNTDDQTTEPHTLLTLAVKLHERAPCNKTAELIQFIARAHLVNLKADAADAQKTAILKTMIVEPLKFYIAKNNQVGGDVKSVSLFARSTSECNNFVQHAKTLLSNLSSNDVMNVDQVFERLQKEIKEMSSPENNEYCRLLTNCVDRIIKIIPELQKVQYSPGVGGTRTS